MFLFKLNKNLQKLLFNHESRNKFQTSSKHFHHHSETLQTSSTLCQTTPDLLQVSACPSRPPPGLSRPQFVFVSSLLAEFLCRGMCPTEFESINDSVVWTQATWRRRSRWRTDWTHSDEGLMSKLIFIITFGRRGRGTLTPTAKG